MRQEVKYVFIKMFETGETSISLINDPIEIYKSGKFNAKAGDKIYQLGNEVELEIVVKQKPVYRHFYDPATKD